MAVFVDKKTPSVRLDRGRTNSRYHLWFAVFSQKRPHGVPTHSRAITGAPGARLLENFRSGAGSAVYFGTFPLLLAPAEGSLRRKSLLTSPLHHHKRGYCNVKNRSCQVSSILRIVIHHELAQPVAQERQVLLVDPRRFPRQDAAAKALDLFARTDDRAARERAVVRGIVNKSVGLQKAGLPLAVAELLKDRVEQLVVPAARFPRQDQQLVALTHAVEHALLFELGVRVDQALGAFAPLCAAVKEQEAHLTAVARRQRLCDLEQCDDAGGVGIFVVRLTLAIFGVKEPNNQQQ